MAGWPTSVTTGARRLACITRGKVVAATTVAGSGFIVVLTNVSDAADV